MIIQGSDLGLIWRELLKNLTTAPHASPRGKPCRERIGVQLRLASAYRNILVNSKRNLNYRFLVAEWLWIALGMNRVDVLARYNSRMRDFSDDGEVLAGAYGPPLSRQLAYAVETLKKDRDSRQAVMTLWVPTPKPSKDIPCTLSIQLLVRTRFDGTFLDLIVTMRSSDVWLGIPYDVFSFTMLANWIVAVMRIQFPDPELRLGTLIMNLGSSHLYDEHDAAAHAALAVPSETLASPQLPHSFMSYPALFMLEPYLMQDGTLEAIPDPVWSVYARILISPNSAQALAALTNLSEESGGKG